MDSSQKFVHDATVELLISSRLQKNKPVINSEPRYNRDDKKFYKKRIIQLLKDFILSRTLPNYIPLSLEEALNGFITESIDFLKMTDMCDIHQSKYITLDNSTHTADNTVDDFDDDEQNNTDDMLFGRIDPSDDDILQTDKYIPEIFTNLDNFIIRTPLSPIISGNSEDESESEFDYARTKTINLRSPYLKKKGVRKKSKTKND